MKKKEVKPQTPEQVEIQRMLNDLAKIKLTFCGKQIYEEIRAKFEKRGRLSPAVLITLKNIHQGNLECND